jgi:hypothetical protein
MSPRVQSWSFIVLIAGPFLVGPPLSEINSTFFSEVSARSHLVNCFFAKPIRQGGVAQLRSQERSDLGTEAPIVSVTTSLSFAPPPPKLKYRPGFGSRTSTVK